jgi:futalosine hydrolase
VLVIAATEAELEPLRRRLAGRDDLLWLVTGVGKAAAACRTALALARQGARACVQVGCAGAYPAGALRIGDVVAADIEILGDEGVETPDGFLELRRLSLASGWLDGRALHDEIPVGRLSAPLRERIGLAAAKGRFAFRTGRLVTVSTGSGTDARAAEMERRWAPLAESMEGAAAALACLSVACRFLEVRGISNIVGNRDRGSWDIPRALENAAEVARIVIEGEGGDGA